MNDEGTEREGGLRTMAWMSGGRYLRSSSIALIVSDELWEQDGLTGPLW
jgi:hypothetical protein